MGIRPIQRQVFEDFAEAGTLSGSGTTIRMYTVDPPGPVPGGPVASEDAPQLDALVLGAPHPNPAATTIQIPYGLPDPGEVELVVMDVLGRQVLELVDARQPEGNHTTVMDTRALAPGVYILRLRASEETRTTPITVVR